MANFDTSVIYGSRRGISCVRNGPLPCSKNQLKFEEVVNILNAKTVEVLVGKRDFLTKMGKCERHLEWLLSRFPL